MEEKLLHYRFYVWVCIYMLYMFLYVLLSQNHYLHFHIMVMYQIQSNLVQLLKNCYNNLQGKKLVSLRMYLYVSSYRLFEAELNQYLLCNFTHILLLI